MWDWETVWTWVAPAVLCLACACLAVALWRAGSRNRRTLGERSWLLERERAAAATTAVDAERARIAAELHDIVSHKVSLMVVQAAAAREVLSTMPEQSARALTAIETAGRDTMTELRHLLGLLAPSAEGDQIADLSPQPSLRALGPLVDRVSFAGLPVEVRILGEPRSVPAGIDLTGYRIVQEALTNALKHGKEGGAEVVVRYSDRYLRVEVLSTGPSVLTGDAPPARPAGEAGTGRGLLGLRERVAVYGGELDARRRLGGGYRVRARIPLDRP